MPFTNARNEAGFFMYVLALLEQGTRKTLTGMTANVVPRIGVRRALLMLAAVLASASAQAAINQVNYSISYDGTPGFDPVAGTGFDTASDNRIVRTNDQFEYLVTLSTTGGDNNVAVVATLPLGNASPRTGQAVARWSYVPATCTGAGSSVSPDGQTLTCNLGNIPNPGTQSVFLNATVLSTTPNGTSLPAPALTVSSSATPSIGPSGTPPAISVTAAPFYDVVVQMSHNGNPHAYDYALSAGPADQEGFYHRPMVGLVAKNPNGNGIKGVEQLDPTQPVHLTASLAGYPAGVLLDNWHNGVAPSGTPAATGSFGDGCGNSSAGSPSAESGGSINTYDRVGDTGGASSSNNTVANGGDCAVTGSTATTVSFDLVGMETTFPRRPTVNIGTGTPIPSAEWWMANKTLVLWTPITSYPASTPINHVFSLGSVTGTSISGQALTGDNPNNNSTSYILQTLSGGSASKIFTADSSLPVPYATQCDPAIKGDCHANYMTAQQTVASRVIYSNNGTTTQTGAYVCEIIDRTAYDLGTNFTAGATESTYNTPTSGIRYGARAGGPYFASTDSSADPYGNGATGTSEYALAACDDPAIQWFSTPAAAEAAGGLVYVRADFASLPGGSIAYLNTRGMILRSTWAATIQVLSPVAETRVAGQPIPAGTILRNEGDAGSSFLTTHPSLRDHLRVEPIRTTSRVAKTVDSPANATSSPQPAGGLLTYRLQPRFSTLFPPLARTFTVTDVLPPHLSYVAGSGTLGGASQEPQILANTPAVGYTTLRWVYPTPLTPYLGADSSAANTAPITYQTRILVAAADSEVLANNVAVSAGSSDYEADCVYVTASQSFGGCTKAAEINVSVQTPPGFQVQKTAVTPQISPGQNFTYRVDYVSFGQDMPARDVPDFIDILPFLGDGAANAANSFPGRSPPSAFSPGAYQLASVGLPANDPTMRVYYTGRTPSQINNDPRDPSNAIPGGTTQWCLASEFATAGCPADIGAATGVRFEPGVASLASGVVYSINLEFSTDPLIAKSGNRFANSVGGRSPDPLSSLLFVNAQANPQVQVVASSLGGRVFVDVDQDDNFDAPDDVAIPNQCVVLVGTTAGGANVTYSMSTDNNGFYLFTSGASVHASNDCSGALIAGFDGLQAGTYSVRQLNQPAGFADGLDHAGTSGGAVGADVVNGIALGLGASATGYDFTELFIRPVLTLVKQVVNDNGGTAVAGDFTLTATGPTTISGTTGAVAVTNATVAAGTYALSETNLPGYTAGTYSCVVNGGAAVSSNSVALVNGDVATCTIVNDDRAATLTLVKTVTNDNGGTAVATDFTLTATGPTPISGTTGATAVTNAAVSAGAYTLGEANLPGYTAGAYSCVVNGGAAVSGNSLTLANGDSATCTINNDDRPATLTLVKTVTNTNGGTAVPTDFTLTATGPTAISGTTGAAAVTNAIVNAGTYALGEANLAGYVAGTYGCVVNGGAAASANSVTLAPGDAATCTINNTDQPVSLTLVKQVVNDNGGTAVPTDFTLTATGPTPISGTTGSAAVTNAAVSAGTYGLGEINLPGYTAGNWSCTAGSLSGSQLTLAGGQNVTCTIVNDDRPARLTLVKQVVNDNGGTAVPTDFTLTATGPTTISGTTGSAAVTNVVVSAGTYALGETNLPGYLAGMYGCSVNGGAVVSGNSVALANGDSATCTIINDDQGATLTLVKQVVNDNGGTAAATDFTLTATGPTPLSGATGTTAVTSARVQPGTYALGETNLPGYAAGTYSCVLNGGSPVPGNSVTLANGDSASCTIVNDDQGAVLTLVKTVTNDNGGTAVPTDFTLTATGPTAISGTTGAAAVTNATVGAGTYALGETNLPGYTAGTYACVVNNAAPVSGNTLVLANGDSATCTVNNDDQPAVLSVDKTAVSVAAVAGTVDEYVARYQIVVRHVSGSAGVYTLTDAPQFDADATVLGATATRNGTALTLGATSPWTLASSQSLAMGATDTYVIDTRVRVAAGSSTANDVCTGAAGNGLFNQATLAFAGTQQRDDACLETPKPQTTTQLALSKQGSTREAEVGDVVGYTIRIRNNGQGIALQPVVVDRLPAGFVLIEGSVVAHGANLVGVVGSPGPVLRLQLDRIDPGAEVTVSYRLRVGVGAQQGDGVNRAQAECAATQGGATTPCSNEDRWRVTLRGGVFTEEGCVAGQIFVDCNYNSVKDGEELGIPGVRMYFENGTYLISDAEGKYSYCGLRPVTHVLKVDPSTLPTRSRLVTSSGRNAGDAGSLFVDLKNGELQRADFIEGSCNDEVIEQVKARRAAGEVKSAETEPGQSPLRLDAKPAPQGNPPQEGTDSANQPIERTRGTP